MNILLKGFNDSLSKQMLERAFRGISIGTCMCIMEDNASEPMPELGATEQLRHSSTQIREKLYPDTDWNEVLPLDEELVENMRHSEAVFLTMIGRYGLHGDIPYDQRKQQYLQHLRYWNHILETAQIELYLAFTIHHQGYDLVIYDLCRLKGIPTLYIDRCHIMDAFFMVDDWEEPGVELKSKLAELEEQYQDQEEIPLSQEYEKYFSQQTKDVDPWFMRGREERLARKSFILKWADVAIRMLFKKPKVFFMSVLSKEFWSRKLREHRTNILYDQYAKNPDLKQPYIYLPLHMQPEATTCPMGGAFTDQELIAQLIAPYLPKDVRIYIKEHPAQSEMCRSEAYYTALNDIPSVTLVPRNFSTFQLTENALAVATVTGTAGFEALFRGKPVLMFGHRFFQYAKGVHRIRTADDCKRAIESICDRKEAPTLRDMRLFLRAIQESGVPYVHVARHARTQEELSLEKRADMMGEFIAQKLQTIIGDTKAKKTDTLPKVCAS